MDQSSICGAIPNIKQEACLKELDKKNIRITIQGGQLAIEIIGSDAAGKLFTGNIHGLVAVETAWLGGDGDSSEKHETAAAMTAVLLTHSLGLSNLRVSARLLGKFLEQLNMHETNPLATPCDRGSGGTEDSVGSHVSYREALWAASCTK